jgi:Peptidase M15
VFSAFQPVGVEYDSIMRAIASLLLLLAAPVGAQTAPLVAPAPLAPPAAQSALWDPASSYITAGQDEPGYRSWYLAAPWRSAQVKGFNDYLASADVAGIVPTWQLLRTATSWKDCGGQPFEVPPTSEWPHMIQTLRYIRDYVIPAVGPVEPVSVYRNPVLNVCAGGAPESAHKLDSAVDLVPLRPTDRITLMRTLCDVHSEHGAPYNAGLGFYAYLRFHVDSTKFRRWNMDPAVAAECPPIVHPEDIASVGQPLPTQPAQPVSQPPAVASAPVTEPGPQPQNLPQLPSSNH